MQYYTNIFAQTYGSGAYGSSTYENGTTVTSGSAGTSSAGGGSGTTGVLTDTGFDILLAVTVACVIVFAALVVRFWKRPAKKSPVSE